MTVWAFAALPLLAVFLLYAYLVHYLGKSSVHAGILLVWRGYLKYRRLCLRPPIVWDMTLASTDSLAVFQAASIAVESFSLTDIAIKVASPRLDFSTDPNGLLYLVALLQEVGYLEEAKAHPVQKEPLLNGAKNGTAVIEPPELHQAAFRGEAHISIAHVTMEKGQLDLPSDVGQIIGRTVEARLAVGKGNVERVSQVTDNAEEDWWERSSEEASTSYCRVRYPLLLLLNSENIKTRLRGWRTDTGFLLNEPIMTLLHFTPDIAQFTLSKLHPLLGYAVNLEGTDHIKTTLMPVDMHLPSEMMSLRLEPLRLQLKTKAFVKGLISLMNAVGRREWEEPHTLEAWTSAITADVYRSGIIVSKRMDIIFGHNVRDGKGFHVCMWGTVDTGRDNAVDMKMGLPASTLRRLGAKEVQEDFVYQMAVGGTAQAPEVNFLRAGKDLAEMILKSNMQRGLPFLKSVMRNPSEKRRIKQAAEIPPPSLPYPWEAFSEAEISKTSKDVKFE